MPTICTNRADLRLGWTQALALKGTTMMNQQFLGIDNFKRLPYSSSSNVGKIEEEAKRLSDAADENYAVIYRFGDLQRAISKADFNECWDSLAVIRQIDAALVELSEHFSNTVAHQSLQLAREHVKESLRRANNYVERLAPFVGR